MKRIFNRNIILLCILFSVERFVFYSFRSSLLFYLTDYLNLNDSKAFQIYGLAGIITLFSYIVAAFGIDRIGHLKDFRLLLASVGLGIISLFFNGVPFLLTGMVLIIIAGVLIKINVFINLFENIPVRFSGYDNPFILMYILINLVSVITAPYASLITSSLDYKLGLPIVVMIPWLLFAPVFFTYHKKLVPPVKRPNPPAINKKILYAILVLIVLILGFINYHIPIALLFSNEPFQSSKILQQGISVLSYTITGIIILFVLVPNYQLKKIGWSVLLLALTTSLICFAITKETNNVAITILVYLFKGAAEILLYPAIFSLILLLSDPQKKGTTLSIVFIILFILSNGIRSIYIYDKMILVIVSGILVLLLLGMFIILRTNKLVPFKQDE